jgi:hypothetical protein
MKGITMAESKMTMAEVEKLFGKKPSECLSTPELADVLENPTSVLCCDDCKYNQPKGMCKKECRKAIIESLGDEVYLDRSEML